MRFGGVEELHNTNIGDLSVDSDVYPTTWLHCKECGYDGIKSVLEDTQ